MLNLIEQFNHLSKREKTALKTINERLLEWEDTLNKESRVANGLLQKRRRDPLDPMFAGSVSVCVSYFIDGDSRQDLIRRDFNATAINGDDHFGRSCGLDSNGVRCVGVRYRLGPMPCCFLLHDLANALLSQNPEGDCLPTLTRITQVAVEVKVTSQFLEVLSESKDASCI